MAYNLYVILGDRINFISGKSEDGKNHCFILDEDAVLTIDGKGEVKLIHGNCYEAVRQVEEDKWYNDHHREYRYVPYFPIELDDDNDKFAPPIKWTCGTALLSKELGD